MSETASEAIKAKIRRTWRIGIAEAEADASVTLALVRELRDVESPEVLLPITLRIQEATRATLQQLRPLRECWCKGEPLPHDPERDPRYGTRACYSCNGTGMVRGELPK